MDTTPPTSHVNPLPQRGTSLSFAVSVTGSDGGSPALGRRVVRHLRRRPTAGHGRSGPPSRPPIPRPPSPARATRPMPSTASPTTWPATPRTRSRPIEASTYLPDLTPPVTSVDGTTGTNPSTVNTSTGTFTLNVTGNDPGGGLADLFRGLRLGRRRRLPGSRPLRHPRRRGRQQGNYHSTIVYQGLTDGTVAHLCVL